MRARNLVWIALFLGACASPQPWTKESASTEQAQADQRACELKATQEVQRRQSRSGSTMGPANVGQSTRRSTSPSSGPFADVRGTQLADEDQLVRECMQEQGYARGAKPK